MNTSTQQETKIETSHAVNSVFPYTRQRRIFTITKFSERHSDFITKSALTNDVFKAKPRHSSKGEIPGNGMLDFGVIVRIGRKVLIDEDAYFRWLDAQQEYRGMLEHSQKITDPDGVQLHITRNDRTVSIADKDGSTVKFSAYLVPELRSTLLDVEKEFGRGLSHAKI